MSQWEITHDGDAVPAVDFMSLLGRCLGNYQMAERVMTTFRATGAADAARLQAAIERADFPAIVEIAHRFQGAASNVSAMRLRELLKRAERLGHEQSLPELLMILSRLPAEWEAFERHYETIAPAAGSAGGSSPWIRSLEPCHAGARC